MKNDGPSDSTDLRAVRAIVIDGYGGAQESSSAVSLPEVVWTHRTLGVVGALVGLVAGIAWCWRSADQYRFTAFVDNPPPIAPAVVTPTTTPDMALILTAVADQTLSAPEFASVSAEAKAAERSSELIRVELTVRADNYEAAAQMAPKALAEIMKALTANSQTSLNNSKKYLADKEIRVTQSLAATEALIELASKSDANDRPVLSIQAAQLRTEAALIKSQMAALRGPQLMATATFTGEALSLTKRATTCAGATFFGAVAGISLGWFWAAMRATAKRAVR